MHTYKQRNRWKTIPHPPIYRGRGNDPYLKTRRHSAIAVLQLAYTVFPPVELRHLTSYTVTYDSSHISIMTTDLRQCPTTEDELQPDYSTAE